MIKDVEYELDEHPDSDFSKSAAIIFDNIDNEKDGVLPLSKFVDLIETLLGGFHSDEINGNIWKMPYMNFLGQI